MLKNIAFIGANPNSFSYNVKTPEAFATAGNNTGNYAFWNAVDTHIGGEKVYLGWNFNSKEIKEKYDVIVLLSSNFLHPERDMEVLANKIEKTMLPVVVVGLGAQAPSENEKIQLKRGTIRFAHIIGERAKTIGVRGEYTAEVLSSLGVKNVEVIGCPSNLTNLDKDLGQKIELRIDALKSDSSKVKSILINVDAHRGKFKKHFQLLHEKIKDYHYDIVCQNPLEIVSLARGEEFDINNLHVKRQWETWCEGMTEDEFTFFVREKFVTFFNVNAWLEHARRFDISVGTRFHGNMLAFQSYVPSFFITHDARTSELVHEMKLPTTSWENIENGKIEDLVRDSNFDGHSYNKNRILKANIYMKILQSHNLPISQTLLKFLN